jgi:CheY-like chemotaxis protein
MNPVRPIVILLVEDNPAGVRLTREALKDAKVLNTLRVAEDGICERALAGGTRIELRQVYLPEH